MGKGSEEDYIRIERGGINKQRGNEMEGKIRAYQNFAFAFSGEAKRERGQQISK